MSNILYIEGLVMTHEEKHAWIMLVVTVAAYATYVVTIVSRANGGPLNDVAYTAVLLWTVGAAIVAAIVAEIAIGVVNPGASRDKDVRDRQISRLGEHVGQSFVVIGAVLALLMAMAEWDRFWIANVIYLGFVLSAILGSITKIVVYRRSFLQW
jgi:hypothetical protein